MIAVANPARTGNPERDLEIAQKAASESLAKGRKALAEAFGSDFNAQPDLLSAAKFISTLKAERDRHKGKTDALASSARQAAMMIAAEIAAIVQDVPLSDNSTLKPISRKVTRLRDELLAAQAELATFKANIRATMIDRGMAELPGMPGYFVGATPLLAAGEAAAVLLHHAHDRRSQEGYLRKRGWRMVGAGTWSREGLGGSLPFESAIKHQAKTDCAPFRQLQVGIDLSGKPIEYRSATTDPVVSTDAELVDVSKLAAVLDRIEP